MKKTLMAAAIVSVAALGFSGVALADDEFVTACIAGSGEASAAGATDEQISGFCVCLDGQVGDDADAIASLVAAAQGGGDPSAEAAAALKSCSAQ